MDVRARLDGTADHLVVRAFGRDMLMTDTQKSFLSWHPEVAETARRGCTTAGRCDHDLEVDRAQTLVGK